MILKALFIYHYLFLILGRFLCLTDFTYCMLLLLTITDINIPDMEMVENIDETEICLLYWRCTIPFYFEFLILVHVLGYMFSFICVTASTNHKLNISVQAVDMLYAQ